MDLALVFGAALAFYSATLAPTVIWGDSAWLALYAIINNIHFGAANAHPLFLAAGRLFVALPGDPARNVAFESAIFGALAVMLLFRISRQLGASRLAAWVGAAALCVSHAFWLHAVIAEVYTANTFFLLAVMSLVIEWSRRRHWTLLAAAAALFAIGLTNHLVLAAIVPAVLMFIVITNPRAFLTRGWLAALGCVVALIALVALFPPAPVARLAQVIWVGPPGISDYFQLTAPLGPMIREAGYYAMYLTYQFPSVTLVLGLVGIRALARDDWRAAVLLLGAIFVNAGVFIHHSGWESASSAKFVFYIADYAIFSIFCALGAEQILQWTAQAWGERASLRWGAALLAAAAIVPPLFYAAIPALANTYGIALVQAKIIPYRDNQTYFLNPNKRGYDGARRFGEEALRSVPTTAVIFADYTPFAILRYLQLAEQVRPDVALRFPAMGERVPVTWVIENGKRRPTYIASLSLEYYDFTGLTGDYDLVPAGPVFEVRPRE